MNVGFLVPTASNGKVSYYTNKFLSKTKLLARSANFQHLKFIKISASNLIQVFDVDADESVLVALWRMDSNWLASFGEF